MKKNRITACLLACSVVTSVFSFGSLSVSAYHELSTVQPQNKITASLAEIISDSSNEVLPVVLWLENINDTEIESKIEEEIGFNHNDLEVDYPAPSEELLNELSNAANGEPSNYLKFLMEHHLELTASARAAEKERTDLYQKTRLSVLKELNTSASDQVINSIGIAAEKVAFVSSFAPMIICGLTGSEIQDISEFDSIKEIDYYTPLEIDECSINLGTTKATVGIDKINAILGLTGSGVGIGIYDVHTMLMSQLSDYDLTASQVSIIGTENNLSANTHAAYCAGIAAGSNGVAPGAHIYSANCNDDWTEYLTLLPYGYDSLHLSNLELLLASNDNTGTYTFKRTVNGSTYALGINGQSTSSGAHANWSPYNSNNASQRWYLETANYRSGDANHDGVMTQTDNTVVLQHITSISPITNNLDKYLADATKDNVIDVSDAVLIAQIIDE